MDILISKIKVPDDIKFEIKKYLYNDQGYTICEINKINELREKNKRIMLNLKFELVSWKISGLSISWLRPRFSGKIGYFASNIDIKNSLNLVYINNLITKDQWLSLGGDMNEVFFNNQV